MEQTMRRITAEEIIEAYQATGLKPAVMDWAHIDTEDNPCACGLAALYLAKMEDADDLAQEVRRLIDASADGQDLAERLALDLDLNPEYAEGFTVGFDGGYVRPNSEEERKAGYEDGAAARKRIFRFKLDEYGNEIMTVLI